MRKKTPPGRGVRRGHDHLYHGGGGCAHRHASPGDHDWHGRHLEPWQTAPAHLRHISPHPWPLCARRTAPLSGGSDTENDLLPGPEVRPVEEGDGARGDGCRSRHLRTAHHRRTLQLSRSSPIPCRPAVCHRERPDGGRSGAVYWEARRQSREEARITSITEVIVIGGDIIKRRGATAAVRRQRGGCTSGRRWRNI